MEESEKSNEISESSPMMQEPSQLINPQISDSEINYCFVVMLTLVGSIGGFLFGYDTGIIAGAQLYFKDDWPQITTVERELTVSLALLGAFFGSLIAGPLSELGGRKSTILLSDLFFVLGSAVMVTTSTVPGLMVGRLIIGLGVGTASMVVPVYLSELAPVRSRGSIVSCYVLAITVGQLSASFIALLCGRNWRLMISIAIIPAVAQLVWMIFMPESQRYLAKNSNFEEAKLVLEKIYSESAAE